MGRHADSRTSRRPVPYVLIAAGLALVLVVGGLVWWLTGDGADCATRSTVAVTVAPEMADLAEELLSDKDALGADGCVTAEVTAQEPLQTAGDLSALDADALPDVWVPDSSLWFPRAGDADLTPGASMATSPVVVGTSSAVVDAQKWADTPPSWSQALTGQHAVAMPDIASSAEALAALAALRGSVGGDEQAADTAVIEAVLAADRASAGASNALDAAGQNSADAALVPVSEQAVYAAHVADANSSLVAVYPSEGSPTLDYPVVRVGSPTGEQSRAVDSVVAALTSDEARKAVAAAGFRDADGAAPPAAGEKTGIREEAPSPVELDPDQVQGLFDRLAALAAPSRLLAVVDVSASMEAPVGDGTRATLARDAAKSALALIPDRSAIGLWVFARELDGPVDWQELVPIRTLGADVDGHTQRDVLQEQVDTFPTRLAPGGTGLYDTTLAAVRKARVDFDPTAVNSVVVITDGTDEDDGSIGLDGLLQTLSAEADPSRPVKVIGIALGPDADLSALQRIGEATGGAAYSAVDENDLQSVLFDALRQRG